MPDKPCCVKCGKEYKPKTIGAGVLEYRDDGQKYRVSACDIYECPGCGHEITYGYGDATHYSAEPKKVDYEVARYHLMDKLVEVSLFMKK